MGRGRAPAWLDGFVLVDLTRDATTAAMVGDEPDEQVERLGDLTGKSAALSAKLPGLAKTDLFVAARAVFNRLVPP